MGKAQLPLIAELDLGDVGDFTAQFFCKFTGTASLFLLARIVGTMPADAVILTALLAIVLWGGV